MSGSFPVEAPVGNICLCGLRTFPPWEIRDLSSARFGWPVSRVPILDAAVRVCQDPRMQEFLEANGPCKLRVIDMYGVERVVLVEICQAMAQPHHRNSLVRPVYGSVAQIWSVQQHQLPRRAFVEKESGNTRWLLFHTWSGSGSHWEDRISFWILRQPQRGHQVQSMHGQRHMLSYSHGLEDQLILILEECNEGMWWAFYVEGPDKSLIRIMSLHVCEASVGVPDQAEPAVVDL